MQKKLLMEVSAYLTGKRRRRMWAKAVCAMACIVVFCTTYALILPAITIENTVFSSTTGGNIFDSAGENHVQVSSVTGGDHVQTISVTDGDNRLVSITDGDSVSDGDNALTMLSCSGPDYTVTVQYGAEAALPEGVTLQAQEISPDTKEYQLYYNQSLEALDTAETAPETLVFARFFDVHFWYEEQQIEPAGPVSVTITYHSAMETEASASCQTIHFAEDGPELLKVETRQEDEETTSFTHVQDGFSVVGNLMTMSYSDDNSTDIGPSVLPVDYYVYVDGQWICAGSTKTGWYGDYTAGVWLNTNRDCITVDQAASILGDYGFRTDADNAALQLAYQRKETDKDANLHSDTQSYADEVRGNIRVIPLARNASPASGYNVYFLPGNHNNNLSCSLKDVSTAGSSFYTVSVYDPNHLVYGADALPETLTRLEGKEASVTVQALPEKAGAVWQCVGADWRILEDGVSSVTNADGSITFTLTNIRQQLRIMPLSTDLGTPFSQKVSYYVYLDDQWTEVGSTSTIYKREDFGRYFVTAAQVESVLAAYGFRAADYSYTQGEGNSLVHQFESGNSSSTFWSNNDSMKLADGTWAIGLSYSAVAYKLYYLPANTRSFTDMTPDSFAGSEEMNGNRFYSVTVRDDAHSIYTDGELSAMRQIVSENSTAEISVQNGNGVIWSCIGKNGGAVNAVSDQEGGYTVFRIPDMNQPVEVVATQTNPSFTVQYYANMPKPVNYGDAVLNLIDTSGAVLPVNGGNMEKRNLGIVTTGMTAANSNGDKTELYRVNTVTELTRLYTEESFEYQRSPSLSYVNKLSRSESYAVTEIWVLKKGKDTGSSNRDDWDIYGADAAFTNEAGQAGRNTILITDGTVLRLVYNTNTVDYHNTTTFYDYNIASKYNGTAWETGIVGINSSGNYGVSLNGERTWNSYRDVLAFGNANCGTGMAYYEFDGGRLNAYNSRNAEYEGCTFGIVSRLNRGQLVYNEWIVAPKLFNEGDASGKQTYSDSSLTFERVGDTYTLSAATLNNSNGQKNTIENLQYFNNPSPVAGTVHKHIYTNNFWPMDQAAGKTDPLFGAYGNSIPYQGFDNDLDMINPGWPWKGKNSSFPISDDGLDHNCFFGMNFGISFTLTEDYVGPLEYYFFGDDDMWVFLDGRLVCDIGGVHSSYGEYVNLWDYIPVGESTKTHTLDFFYTERGASGSTCYMSFTLPSVTSSTISQDTGSLQIAKKVEGAQGADFSDEEFRFRVDLLTAEGGEALDQTFSYHNRQEDTYGTIKSGQTLTLKPDQTVEISGIPAGSYYLVTELDHNGYQTTVNGVSGYITAGTIENGNVQTAAFVNTPYYELPSTGGPGTLLYTLSGVTIMAGTLMYDIKRRRKRGR